MYLHFSSSWVLWWFSCLHFASFIVCTKWTCFQIWVSMKKKHTSMKKHHMFWLYSKSEFDKSVLKYFYEKSYFCKLKGWIYIMLSCPFFIETFQMFQNEMQNDGSLCCHFLWRFLKGFSKSWLFSFSSSKHWVLWWQRQDRRPTNITVFISMVNY